jgi:hypothetical protein
MQGFTRLGDISSAATRSVEMRELSEFETQVYQYFLEKLGNGRVPQCIELLRVARYVGVNYNKARRCKNALVKKGLLEQWTNTFRDPNKGPGYFRKATYYRIKF